MKNLTIIFLRSKILRLIRNFFRKRKFLEVETPLLLPAVIPEAHLEYFETFLKKKNGKRQKMFLSASPEASLKKLLARGLGSCFEITKSFRNRDVETPFHLPEFTILEWYRKNANYQRLMEDCQDLVLFLQQHLNSGTNEIIYQKQKINLSPPWKKISMADAFAKYASISFQELQEEKTLESGDEGYPWEKMAQVARKKGYRVEPKNTWEELFHQIFLNEVEPQLKNLSQPVILYDYPRPLGALAKVKDSDPFFCERFELYLGGLELANGYTELTDFGKNKKRFTREMKLRKLKGKTAVSPDREFLKTVKKSLPPCAGIALGIDRLIMLFANVQKISEVIPCF